MFEILLINYL